MPPQILEKGAVVDGLGCSLSNLWSDQIQH